MARKTSKFMIGLFVTLGVLIGMVAVVWLGASKYFEKGKTYVTFFDESVQGLQVDSAVKYRGVEVGRVDAIRVAPDNRLIEVVMKVDMKGHLERDYVSQLKAAGITGIVFIEMDRKDPEKADLSPRISFAAEHPIIPSQPSDIKQILSAVESVIDKIKQIDTQGISDQIKSTTKTIEDLLGGEKVDRIVTGVDSTVAGVNSVVKKIDQGLEGKKLESILGELQETLVETKGLVARIKEEFDSLQVSEKFGAIAAHLESATGKIDQIIGSGKIEEAIGEARGVLTEAQNLVKTTKGEIERLRLSENLSNMVGKTNHLIENVDTRTTAISNSLRATSENLRRASEALELLIDRVSTNPPELLFGEPTPPRKGR
jgi:phospholipid/cholesterol/gamma-HCH transport system substrate-binding protein